MTINVVRTGAVPLPRRMHGTCKHCQTIISCLETDAAEYKSGNGPLFTWWGVDCPTCERDIRVWHTKFNWIKWLWCAIRNHHNIPMSQIWSKDVSTPTEVECVTCHHRYMKTPLEITGMDNYLGLKDENQ